MALTINFDEKTNVTILIADAINNKNASRVISCCIFIIYLLIRNKKRGNEKNNYLIYFSLNFFSFLKNIYFLKILKIY